MNRSELYQRLPVPLQDAMATAYGLRELPRRHGGAFKRNVAELAVREWWSPEQLAADQSSRLRRMVTWSAARVPHYRDLFASTGIDPRDIRTAADLAQLPYLDKEQVRAEPERFLPTEPRPRLVPQTTGGTTGTPLRYWATLDAVRFNYGVDEARTRRWAGVALGDRMASFHGQPIVPDKDSSGPYWRRNRAFNQLYCSVYHLTDETLPSYVAALEQFDPVVVAGYTSAVHRVATHLLATGDVGRIRPRAVIVSSEVLLPGARDEMETAFGCRVFNAYSLGELVAYVSECDHGELHVSTEYGVVELVDDGAGGTEIVATGLINRGMPLLRYRTGDAATPAAEGAASACGRSLPLLGQIMGRVDDVVHTPEGAVVGPAPMSLAFQRVPHLRRAQVHQDSADELRVLLEVTDEFVTADQEFLVAELHRRLGPTIRLEVERVDTIPRTSGGKERLVVSSIGRARA